MEASVKTWMEGLSNRAEGTRNLYSSHFRRFIEHVGIAPDQLRQMKWEENQAQKPWERSRVENLVREYLKHMDEEKGLSCGYAQSAFTAIMSFFKKNGLPLNLDANDRPEGDSLGGSAVPTREQIKRIVNGTESLRYRALILFLKDSGLRTSDVLRLRWKELQDYRNGFLGVKILTKKKKVKATAFVGPETTEALMIYKQARIKGTEKVPPEENIEDHPIFALRGKPKKPLRTVRVSNDVGAVITRVGFNNLTPHGLRKFWEQNMHAEREAYLKQMNGRKLKTDERAYLTRNPADLFAIYKENYPNLRVLTRPISKEIEEIEQQLRKEYEERIRLLERQIQLLVGCVL